MQFLQRRKAQFGWGICCGVLTNDSKMFSSFLGWFGMDLILNEEMKMLWELPSSLDKLYKPGKFLQIGTNLTPMTNLTAHLELMNKTTY